MQRRLQAKERGNMPEHDGIFFATHPDVYEPSDDTWLLAEAVGNEATPGINFLEVGCGTGFVSVVAAKKGAKVTCTDANPHAVQLALHNARQNGVALDAHEVDLLHGLPGPFDLVAFNPPYLPTGPDDVVQGPLNLAFDGGQDGNAVVLRFADQVAALTPRPRCVLVVHSSLSDPKPLEARLEAAGYRCEVALQRRFFFEELTVRRFRQVS